MSKNWIGILIFVTFIIAMSTLPWLSSFIVGLFFTLILVAIILNYVMGIRLVKHVRNHLQSLGYTVLEIKKWRNHYGVTFLANSQKHYLKFEHSTSFQKIVDWPDGGPESLTSQNSS